MKKLKEKAYCVVKDYDGRRCFELGIIRGHPDTAWRALGKLHAEGLSVKEIEKEFSKLGYSVVRVTLTED